MMKYQNNLAISCETNSRYLVNSKLNHKITKFNRLIIVIFPFATFIGQFINIFGVNISNIYSLILGICVFNNFLKVKYKNIVGYIVFFLLMLLYAFTSLIWGDYSNVGLTLVFPLITCFVAMAYISGFNEKELSLFLKTFSIFTIVVLIMSLMEILTGKYIFFNNLDFIYSINLYNLHYPGVAFPNPNDLGQYLLVGFPLVALMLFEKKEQIILPMLLFFITIFVLINTASRLSLMSMVIIVAFYFVVSKFNKGKKFFKIFLALALVVALIGILPYFGFDFSKYNIVDNFLKVDASQDYFTGRETIYSTVFQLGINNMVFGSGLGGSYTISAVGTHNMFLFIFADLGFIFTFGFIAVLFSAFVFLYKYKNIEICGCHLNLIILSIIVIFPMFSCISSGNEQRKIVWILFGLVLTLIKNSKIKISDLKH